MDKISYYVLNRDDYPAMSTVTGRNNYPSADGVPLLDISDEDYIKKNVTTINRFTDLKNNSHWSYNDILESSNTHKAIVSDNSETWVK